MKHNEPLVIKFWKNPEIQLLQIEKEIQYLQMRERYEFLEKYRQALQEFFDIFDSHNLLEKCYVNIHLVSDYTEHRILRLNSKTVQVKNKMGYKKRCGDSKKIFDVLVLNTEKQCIASLRFMARIVETPCMASLVRFLMQRHRTWMV